MPCLAMSGFAESFVFFGGLDSVGTVMLCQCSQMSEYGEAITFREASESLHSSVI